MPCRHLYTNTAVLKVIRWRTGSQCSWRRIGVMRSDILAPVTRCAAAFWTDSGQVVVLVPQMRPKMVINVIKRVYYDKNNERLAAK